VSIRRKGSFDETAFLSGDMVEITKREVLKHRSLFDLAYDLNAYSQKLKFECDVKNKDRQALITIGLYFRVLDSFSSAIILCENSLGHDASALTRVGIEAMFYMKAVAEKKGFVNEYVKSDQKSRLKLLNVASQPDSALHELFEKDSEHLSELKQKLKDEIDSEQISEQQAIEVAKKVELQPYYDYAYRVLSQYVHPSPRSLSKYYKFNNEDEITDLRYLPDEDMIPMALFTSVSNVLMAIKILVNSFELKGDGIENFEKRFKECNEEYGRKEKPSD